MKRLTATLREQQDEAAKRDATIAAELEACFGEGERLTAVVRARLARIDN